MKRLAPLWRLLRLFYDAYLRFADHDGWAIASHIALTFVTSMFPFLIFIAALAGLLGTQKLADEATRILLQTWPEQVARPLTTQIGHVLTQSHLGLLTLGMALAIYFSSSGIEAMRVGLDRAYEAKDKRPWWLARLLAIGFVLIGAAALLAVGFLIVLSPFIWGAIVRFAPAMHALEQLVTFARLGTAALVIVIALIILHKHLPAGRRTLVDIAPGIALTLAMWIEAAYFFGVYFKQFARNYVTVYAGLASAMIVLVFLYALAVIFIYGAELNAAILHARQGDGKTHPERK